MRKYFVSLFLPLAMWAQQGSPVNQVLGPPPNNGVSLYFCGSSLGACGSGNTSTTLYICSAPAVVSPPTVFAVSGTPALISIAVSSNVGTVTFGSTAYWWQGQQLIVAGSATAALNGTYAVSAVSGSTATITTSGVSNATYTDMTVSTAGPLLNAKVWSIQAFTYTSSLVSGAYYAGNPSVQISGALACSDRTKY